MSSFVSKSGDEAYIRQRNLHRGIEPPESQTKIRYIFSQLVIFYIGNLEQSFLDQGDALGFDLRKYKHQDISILLHGSALIVSDPDMEFKKRIETINFAACYGIPVIWFSRKSIPHRYTWRFKLSVVGDVNAKEFWRQVWNLNL